MFAGAAQQGDELKVEQGVKDLRSLSLPIMKPSAGPYILSPASDKAEPGSLGRREGDDLLVSHMTRRLLHFQLVWWKMSSRRHKRLPASSLTPIMRQGSGVMPG